MSREELRTAGQRLAQATHDVSDDEQRERIAGLADQLETLADADRGPDQGRIARMENILHEIEADLTGDARETIREAHDHLREYRATVGGV